MEIRALRATDPRDPFRSGDADLDRFFARYAGQNQFRHHIGVTYVAVDGDRVLAYATVAPATIETEVLAPAVRRKLPDYPLPALRLARLAVDQTARGRGLGSQLLRHVLGLSVEMADRFGCIGVIVDAKPGAVAFYERFGFQPLEVAAGQLDVRPVPQAMILPLSTILAAIPQRG